jgi:hypothetical protein
MPVILRNNNSSIEFDIDPSRTYTAIKGAFDVFMEDIGIEGGTAFVYVILRSRAMIDNVIKLDWRDTIIMPEEVGFTSAAQLRDTLIGWNLQQVSTSAAVAIVESSETSVLLLASNAVRKTALFFNNSEKDLYIKYGSASTTSNFTVKLLPGAYFEMPYPCYTGAIYGVWNTKNGNAMVTECT